MGINLVLLFAVFAYKTDTMNFTISSHKIQHQISSASGSAYLNNHFYVIGDDSPYLFKLNKELDVVSKHEIYSYDGPMVDGRIPKPDKPDIESLEKIGDNELIGFGSGSKSPERDIFFHITINDIVKVERYSLISFYKTLKEMEVLQGYELNIEGAAYFNNVLYLFNRSQNVVFSVDYKGFINHIKDEGPCPDINFEVYTLPQINGIEAGFSGATTNQKGDLLVVTASVEDTDNAYDDGEVLGSFIGVISMDAGQPTSTILWTQIDALETPLKVESVLIENENDVSNMDVVLVTDSDGGDSLVIRGNLTW